MLKCIQPVQMLQHVSCGRKRDFVFTLRHFVVNIYITFLGCDTRRGEFSSSHFLSATFTPFVTLMLRETQKINQ